jgi:hypothetical protein
MSTPAGGRGDPGERLPGGRPRPPPPRALPPPKVSYCAGLARIVRLGPAFLLRIPIRALNPWPTTWAAPVRLLFRSEPSFQFDDPRAPAAEAQWLPVPLARGDVLIYDNYMWAPARNPYPYFYLQPALLAMLRYERYGLEHERPPGRTSRRRTPRTAGAAHSSGSHIGLGRIDTSRHRSSVCFAPDLLRVSAPVLRS